MHWDGSSLEIRGTIDGSVISGSEFYAAGGAVHIGASGINIAHGTGNASQVSWGNGAAIYGHGQYLSLNGPGYISMDTPGASVALANGAFWPAQQLALGTSGAKWGELHVANNIFFENPPETTFQDPPVVWSQGNRQLYIRTDAFTGNVPQDAVLVVRGGLVVGYL